MKSHNHIAIGALIVFHQVLGFLWYAPFMFLHQWLEGRGITFEQMNASLQGENQDMTPFAYGFVGSLLSCYLISWLVVKLGLRTWKDGLILGLVVFAGLVFPALAPHYKFLAIADSVMLIDLGMSLVATLATCAVLAGWRKKV